MGPRKLHGPEPPLFTPGLGGCYNASLLVALAADVLSSAFKVPV